MRRVVAHPKLFSDHLGHPLARPHIPSKTVRRCSLDQKFGQPGALFCAQARSRPGSDPTPQALHALFTPSLEPLAYGSLAHTQSVSYLLLIPSLLFEFPGSKTSSFAPVSSLFRK